MRRSTLRALVGVLAGSAVLPRHAWAQSSLDQPFPEGLALQYLEPAPAGDRFFVSPDATAAGESSFYANLLGNYELGPALVRTDNVTGEERSVIESRFFLHGGLSYALADRALLHLDVPFAVAQRGETGAANEPDGGKLGDVRVGGRFALTGRRQDPFALGLGADVWLPTGSEDDLISDGKVRANPKALVSGKAGAFVYSANLGYLFRKDTNVGSLRVGPSLTFGAAAGISVADETFQIGPELYGTSPDAGFDADVSPIQALFGAKVRLGEVQLGAGIGTGLSSAPGVAPRAVFSIGLVPEVDASAALLDEPIEKKDADGDGVADADDACPDTAGKPSADLAQNGCPAEPSRGDLDGDGIVDVEDACPSEAGEKSDNAATSGCPPADQDGDGITDREDACPAEKGPRSDDASKSGCPPPPDADGDAIPDASDACPNEAGLRDADPTRNGCPEAKAVKPAGPPPPPIPAGDRAIVSFSGYERFDDGRARVFVKLDRKVSVTAQQTGNVATYTLAGARIVIRNNRNPLLTGYFDSLLAAARLEPAGNDVKLVLQLREPARLTHGLVEFAGGASLVVDLPPPSVKPSPGAAAPAPAPAR